MAEKECQSLCAAFCGFFMLVLAVMCWALNSIAKASKSNHEQERADISTAWDSMCTMVSSPGTAAVTREDFNCGKNCKMPTHRIQCLGGVRYTDDTYHRGGSKEVSVLAKLDFAMNADSASLCNTTLMNAWANVRFLNNGRTRTVAINNVETEVSTEWTCGDFGWVGCKTTGSFFSASRTCEHFFSHQPGFDDDLGGFSSVGGVSGGSASSSCPIEIRHGTQYKCSIDAHEQIRLGSTQELLEEVDAALEGAHAASQTLKTVGFLFLAVSISCCIGACCCNGICAHLANYVKVFLQPSKGRSDAYDAGSVVGHPREFGAVSGSQTCSECGGVGSRGLFGPKGLGLVSFSCEACNGTGTLTAVVSNELAPPVPVPAFRSRASISSTTQESKIEETPASQRTLALPAEHGI